VGVATVIENPKSCDQGNAEHPAEGSEQTRLQPWVKPAITSFQPVRMAEGVASRPLDGINNLS